MELRRLESVLRFRNPDAKLYENVQLPDGKHTRPGHLPIVYATSTANSSSPGTNLSASASGPAITAGFRSRTDNLDPSRSLMHGKHVALQCVVHHL
jgi:hypothetical protein